MGVPDRKLKALDSRPTSFPWPQGGLVLPVPHVAAGSQTKEDLGKPVLLTELRALRSVT